MLYFSKLKLFIIYTVIIFLTFFSSLNFINERDKNSFFSKNINLGLDLQGGSYLLLEVASEPLIIHKLQNKLINLRKILKEKNIKYQNLKIEEKSIKFIISKDEVAEFKSYFLNKDNPLNSYFNKYRSFEMDYSIENNLISIEFSKFGIIEIKNSSLEESLEIVRRRIDEVGTNEPTIQRRGNDRILVELPGLDDPNRIKSLLGKTANLSFRFITDQDSADFGSEKMFFDDGSGEAIVSKRIILSGENLIDAKPQMDNQTKHGPNP